MTPNEFVQLFQDALQIATAVMTSNPGLGLEPAVDILQKLALELPPVDAKDLDPADRAAADKEAADREAAKFGK